MVSDETWEDICRIDRLCHEVAFEDGDMDKLRREMAELIGEEELRKELKKRMRVDWVYNGFSYALIYVDIIRDRYYHDPDYKRRYFGNLKDSLRDKDGRNE